MSIEKIELNQEIIRESKAGNTDNVKFIIALGADPHARDQYLLTPLHLAARAGHITTLEFLLTVDSETELLNQNNNTPLHSAAYGNKSESIELLLKRGANIHALNKDGDTPLHSAAWKNCALAITTLINHHADLEKINNDGDSALHLASWNNNLEAIVALIIFGRVNINSKNNDGETPLHLATRKVHIESINLLVSMGADLHVKNELNQTIFDLPQWYDFLVQTVNQFIRERMDEAARKYANSSRFFAYTVQNLECILNSKNHIIKKISEQLVFYQNQNKLKQIESIVNDLCVLNKSDNFKKCHAALEGSLFD